jgi:hypothetical protein
MGIVPIAPCHIATASAALWKHCRRGASRTAVVTWPATVGRQAPRKASLLSAPGLDTATEHEDRTPTHGYAATREAAMAAFAKSWRRE